ncbi:hypothetical protein LPB140_02085 [Sphingorhabdus lutea]|uniref:Calcineurin-like phosphoesterase domain-containing protein n=1 Tax=Sphingorhabdus lutea TaxID=1913578 RepID=A0A1L3J9M6_9SPHN|nr:metallophosphoesterase [Sphingorhabdus lutea]APG61820.1 hypothetical protein LPB140_02085 [Sphingorhabdus lutea]
MKSFALSKKIWLLLGLIFLGLCLIGYMYFIAISDPIIRRANIIISNDSGVKNGTKILLVSDIHVAGPDMPPHRLAKIVSQINAQNADMVVFAGDFVSDKLVSTRYYETAQAVAPLEKLTAPMGVIAVMGNHDHWRDANEMRQELRRQNIRILDNEAAQIGPFNIGGVDDLFTQHMDLSKTLAAMNEQNGFPIIISHSPDLTAQLPDKKLLILAGHTHCGQISLPFFGPIFTASKYGNRYACGLMKEGKKTIIVGAGLGTSILPLRLGARPDMWLITLKTQTP